MLLTAARDVVSPTRFPGPCSRSLTHHNLAIAYLQLGQTAAAVRNFQKAIDLSNAGFAPSLYGLAMLLYRNKDRGAAELLVQRALVLEPSAAGKYCLGTIQFALGRISEAERRTHEAIDLDPGLGDSYFLLARIHEAQQNPSATIDDVRTYFHLSPNGSMKADALALLHRAQQQSSVASRDSASLH